MVEANTPGDSILMNGGIVKVWVGKNLPKFLNSYQKSDSLQNYSRPIIGEIFSEFICFQK